MRVSCEVDVAEESEDDSDEHYGALDEDFWLEEQLWFEDGSDYEDYIMMSEEMLAATGDDFADDDMLAATEDENEETVYVCEESEEESEEESDSSDRDEQATMMPMIAEAPRVMEPCLRIEKVPGVCKVKTKSFRICGDNLDKVIHRRFLRLGCGNISLHCFHSYAVLNRIDFSNLSDDLPDNSLITNLKNVALSLQPTALDDQILRKNVEILISRILCTKMNFFGECFHDLVQWHINHKYTPEMSQKSVVVRFSRSVAYYLMFNVALYIGATRRSHEK